MKKLLASTLLLGTLISFPFTNIEARVKKAAAVVVPKASALCKDGTLSYSKTRQGTCSHHKGVKVWY